MANSLGMRAAVLLQQHVVPGDRVLLYPPGLANIAAFMSCFYAGVVAMPAPQCRAKLSPRLEALVRDARPARALTTDEDAWSAAHMSDICRNPARRSITAPQKGVVKVRKR